MGGETGAPEIPYCRSLSLLGERAAGTLYAADSDRYGGPVTVTVYPRPADDRDPGRFEAAVETARRLGVHPHMPTIHASGRTDGGRPYVVSDGHARTTAQGVLATSGVLGVDSALAIGIALAGALETAHRAGVIHRGVAPEVVLLLPDGQPLLAEAGLADFARPQGASAALSRWIPYHAPPEVLEDTEVSPATDVYSLASVVYSLLVGQPPHPSSGADDSTASLLLRILQMPMPPIERSDVPPGLEDTLRAALSHSPAKRPQHALELAWALQEAQRLVGLDVTEPVVLDLTSGGSGGLAGSGGSGVSPGAAPTPAAAPPPAAGSNGSGGRDWSWLASVPPAAPGGGHRPPAAQPPAALPPAPGNGAGAPTAGNGTSVFAAPPANGLTGPQAREGGAGPPLAPGPGAGPENGARPPLEARRRPADGGPPNGAGLPLGLPAPQGGAGTPPPAGHQAGNPPVGLDDGSRPPLGVGPGDAGRGRENGARPPLEARNRPGGFGDDGAGHDGGTGTSVFAPGGGSPAGGLPSGGAYRTGSDERRVAGGFPAGGAYRGGDDRRPAGGGTAAGGGSPVGGGATGPLARAGAGTGGPGSPAGGSEGQPVTPWWAGPPNGGDAPEARAPGPPDLGPLNRPAIDPTVLAEALARQNRPGTSLPADSPLHQPLPSDERPPIDTRRLEAFEPARPGLPAAVAQARQAPAPAAPPQERRRSEPDAAPATPDDAGGGGRRSRRSERRRQPAAGQPAARPTTAPGGRQPATGIPTAERPAASRAGAATVTDDRAVSALERARQARLERQRREREAASPSGGDAPAARRPIGATPDMAPKRTGPPALPVLVLVALVVILGLGGAWMVISGTDAADPAPSTSTGEQEATTSTEQGGQAFSPNRASDLTAVETPEGVQLDWEGPVGVDYLVRILSPAEPPRPIGAGPATALLIPATAVQPGGAYCFDVVAAPEDGAPPVSVPDDSNEAVLPTACINGAQPDAVIRP